MIGETSGGKRRGARLKKIREGLWDGLLTLDAMEWRQILRNMPVTILIDPQGGYYNVRDNSLKYIWADDMSPSEYEPLLREMDRALGAPRGKGLEAALRQGRTGEAHGAGQPRRFDLICETGDIQTEVYLAGRGGQTLEIRMAAANAVREAGGCRSGNARGGRA